MRWLVFLFFKFIFWIIKGKKILQGIEYLILNKEIDQYKKLRTKADQILVTLGGSDTYGVTLHVLKILKKYNIHATIHIGPSFEHTKELREEINENYRIHIIYQSHE